MPRSKNSKRIEERVFEIQKLAHFLSKDTPYTEDSGYVQRVAKEMAEELRLSSWDGLMYLLSMKKISEKHEEKKNG